MSNSKKLRHSKKIASCKTRQWGRGVLFLPLVFVLAFMTGCLQGDKKAEDLKKTYGDENSATFLVPTIDIQSQPSDSLNGWAIPESKYYRFEACILNRATRDKVISQKFQVENDFGVVHRGETDTRGCLRWQEKMPFNFFGAPRYLEFTRTIRGSGIIKGFQKVRFALDPWKGTRGGDHLEWEYLNQPGSPDNQSLIRPELLITGNETQVLTAMQSGWNHKLLVDGVQVYLQQEKVLKEGVELSMSLEMKPWVRLQKMDGTFYDHYFQKGKFTVYASVLGMNMGESSSVNASLTPMLRAQSVKMINGQLMVKFEKFNLDVQNTSGNLAFALHVLPEGIDHGELVPYKAIYKMGDYANWLGKESPVIDHNNSETFDVKYDDVMGSLDVLDLKNKSDKYYAKMGYKKLEGYEFSRMDISYTSVLPGETATQRTIAYDVSVKVTQPILGGMAAENKRFLIKTDRYPEGFISDPTDHNGVIGWEDQVTHAYYEVEHFIRKPIFFQVISDDPDMRFEKRIDAAINPWDLFATFGKDLRYDKNAKRLLEEYEAWAAGDKTVPYKIPSRFNVDKFSYTAIKFDYQIDSDLSLEVKKSVLFKIDPEVQRYSSMVEGRKIEWLRDGVWLMKVAIQKDYLDPAMKGSQIIRNCDGYPEYIEPGQKYYSWVKGEDGKERCQSQVRNAEDVSEEDASNQVLKVDERHFVTFQKRLVRVINGRINTPITLSMRDLRLMRIRSNLLVQLEPIDETKLGVANWLREKIDERAEIEARLRGMSPKEYLDQAQEVFDSATNWFKGHQEEIEKDRERVQPKKEDVLKIYNNEELSDEQKYERGQRELEAKRDYWEQRKSIIDNFLRKLDSSKIRDAYSSNDREAINKELYRVYESEDGLRDMLMPLDMSKYAEGGGSKKSVYGDQVRQHYFWQEGNQPIDVGILNAINEEFNMEPEDLARLRLNDFTVESLGASFSLDLLVEPFEVSGLEKRTFIGPVTFLINSNASHIRPTDTLAEVFCRNNSCNENEITKRELKEWTYEGDKSFMYQRFYNSVRHFFDKDVDDLIICKMGGLIKDPTFCGPNQPFEPAKDKNGQRIYNRDGSPMFYFLGYEEIRSRRLDIASLMSNFLELYNLKYISLAQNPQPLQVFDFNNPDCTVLNSHSGYGKKRVRNTKCFVPFTKSSLTGVDRIQASGEFLDLLNNHSLVSEDEESEWFSKNYTQLYNAMKVKESKVEESEQRQRLRDMRNQLEKYCHGDNDPGRCQEVRQEIAGEMSSTKFKTRSFLDVEFEAAKLRKEWETSLSDRRKSFKQVVTHEDLLTFIKGVPGEGPKGDAKLLAKFCTWMTSDLVTKLDRGGFLKESGDEVRSLGQDILWKCIEPGELTVDHPFLRVDEKMRVIETGEFRFKGGKSMNINLGANTGIDQKSAVAEGPSWNLLKLVESTAEVAGAGLGFLAGGPIGAGVGLLVGKMLPAVGGPLGLSYSLKWDSGRGRSNGTSLNLGTYLVMQTATFDIQLESFERCVALRFDSIGLVENTSIVKSLAKLETKPQGDFPLTPIEEERVKEQRNIFDTGMMLCSGEVETPERQGLPPKAIRERYYYFTQHFTEGDMLDAGDLYNHPWLLMLRGRRDFNVFMASLNQFATNPRAYYDMSKNPMRWLDNKLSEPITMVKEYEWPIENMIRTYLDVLPTFPGMYTALPNEPRDFPWGEQPPGRSFSERISTGMGTQKVSATLQALSRDEMDSDPDCQEGGGEATCIVIDRSDPKQLKEHNLEGMFD